MLVWGVGGWMGIVGGYAWSMRTEDTTGQDAAFKNRLYYDIAQADWRRVIPNLVTIHLTNLLTGRSSRAVECLFTSPKSAT